MFNEKLFKNLDVSKNFILIESKNNEFYLDFWKKYSKSYNFKKHLFSLENMLRLPEIIKYGLKHNFYYLRKDKKLCIKLFD